MPTPDASDQPSRGADRPDIVAVTSAAIAHADAVIAAVASRTDRLRERWITGPSPSLEPGEDGLVARVQVRVELADGTDVVGVVDEIVALLRSRGVALADPEDVGDHRRARGTLTDRGEVEVDGATRTRWLALRWVTAPQAPPADLPSLVDLDAAFLDRVDPDGDRFRDA